MKLSKMFMPTLREVPTEASVASHQLLLRAGMIRSLANGLFAYLPMGLKSFRKVENIVREEMDAIGCLEFRPPVVVPGELWQESGRWISMGPELLRFQNRLSQDLILSPTAEESFTFLLRNEISSYKQYPISGYQIHTKYRDEIRPRYGLMRTREFTMKDAYSFHTSEEDLHKTYLDFRQAYISIFKRCSLDVIKVEADSGAMGGSGSEEFMMESEIGDDTLLICPKCNYSSNEEKATCACDGEIGIKTDKMPEIVDTPNMKTIEDVSSFLKLNSQHFVKTLIYSINESELLKDRGDEVLVAVAIRGDLEVNEAKLKAKLKAVDAVLATDAQVAEATGSRIGFIGPVGLKNMIIIVDETVMKMHDAIVGALEEDKHLIHIEPSRDFVADYVFDLRTVKANDKCPSCGEALYTKKGNELGHIFKLGNKYSKSMNMTYLDENGEQRIPLMGCYGIGIDRLMASIVEAYHDENGIMWPMAIAPYTVCIVPIKYEGKMKEMADELYEELKGRGVEVLLDDREERTGVKFKDMDLIGIPIRLVVGEQNPSKVEFKLRSDKEVKLIGRGDISDFIIKTIAEKTV